MRTGVYVEGRYFGANQAQAAAYARNVSAQSKRSVVVEYLSPVLKRVRLCTVDAGVRPDAIKGVNHVA